MTKEQILDRMREEMPFLLPERIRPYIEEAMQMYAEHQLLINGVSEKKIRLNALIGKEEYATLDNSKKCRILNIGENNYLIKENHNDQVRWVGISDLSVENKSTIRN